MVTRFEVVVGLAATACLAGGCGPSPPTEPAKFVEDESARPITEPPAPATAAATTDDPPSQPASFVRQAALEDEPAEVPPVLLTAQHERLCRLKVGGTMPELELPKIGGGRVKLASLYGSEATVVVFWSRSRRMALDELADLGPDVLDTFGSRGVAVVGIAVKESAGDARATVRRAGVRFTNLLDADGKAFAIVGAQKLPWTLVLDAAGRIVWFDIEYSHATRRELQQALLATLK